MSNEEIDLFFEHELRGHVARVVDGALRRLRYRLISRR